MGFVLEEQQPFFGYTVMDDLHFDGAGIDFFRFIEFGQFALFFEISRGNRGKIHEVDGFIFSAEFLADGKVLIVCFLQQRVLKYGTVDGGQESGVAAVVRPVRIQHTHFRDGGIAVFTAEIIAAAQSIFRPM